MFVKTIMRMRWYNSYSSCESSGRIVTQTATLWLPLISVTVLSLNHSLISVNALTRCHLLASVTALKLQHIRWFKRCIHAIVDWWHVVCMWGEPCSVFSLIVLIFYACACVRARSATNNRRSGDAPCGRVIKLYWYEIIHQCTLRWAFYLHILFSPADTVHFGASPGSGSVVNVRIIYVYTCTKYYAL
jgi:hypothetical protein